MDHKQIFFNENELKKVVFSAVLMSSADRELYQKEQVVIEQFLTDYWGEEFGDALDYFNQVLEETNELVDDTDHFQQNIDVLASELNAMLTEEQCLLVHELLGKVMLADNRLDKNEAILMGTFKKKIKSCQE